MKTLLDQLEESVRKAGKGLNLHTLTNPECHWYEPGPRGAGMAQAHGALQAALRIIAVLKREILYEEPR